MGAQVGLVCGTLPWFLGEVPDEKDFERFVKCTGVGDF